MKLKFDLVEFGDMELFEDNNEVDTDEWTGWLPFAHLGEESQFLAIHSEAPYRVGMWHENGKIYDVWASLDDFVGRVLESKKDKTPCELLDKLDKASKVGAAQMFRPTIVNARPMIVTKALADKLAAFGDCVRITTLKR